MTKEIHCMDIFEIMLYPIMWKCITLQLCIICWLSASLIKAHSDPSSLSVCPCQTPPPGRMPSLSSVDLFFRLEVQRLSCPQHVLVLRSAAAGTCDDRVCECRGVSGVKCVYRGCMAGGGMQETPSFHLVTSCAGRAGRIQR